MSTVHSIEHKGIQPNAQEDNKRALLTAASGPLPKNLPALIQNRIYRFGEDVFISQKSTHQWVNITWNEFGLKIEEIARGLLYLEIGRADKVCIFSNNCPEWVIMDAAVLSLGAISVPIYPTNTAAQAKYILHHSDARAIAVEGKEQLDKVLSYSNELPKLKHIIVFHPLDSPMPVSSTNILPLDELCRTGEKTPYSKFYDCLRLIRPQDLATIVYTSGTTGDPKGVMLTHENILENCKASASVLPVDRQDQTLSFLPLSHTFERTCGFYTMLFLGARVAFAESIAKVVQNLKEVSPTILICVPRILEKIHNRVYEQIFQKPKIIQRLFFRAIRTAREKPQKGLFHSLERKIYNVLFFKKIRARLGGRIRFLFSGGAALSSKVAEFFQTAGLTVLQGYGLTETSPVISVNRYEKNKIGTVGLPLPGIEVKLATDGEILVKGPSVMEGYFKDEKATAQAFDNEGFFHTGDIGNIDQDGYISITDRKKEIIITSGGKKITPQGLENQLIETPLIEQACIVGEGRKYLSVLLVPNFDVLKKKVEPLGIKNKNPEELIKYPEALRLYNDIINNLNAELASFQTIKKFILLAKEFSMENDEITPTLKLRRKTIAQHYASVIETMYQESRQDGLS